MNHIKIKIVSFVSGTSICYRMKSCGASGFGELRIGPLSIYANLKATLVCQFTRMAFRHLNCLRGPLAEPSQKESRAFEGATVPGEELIFLALSGE